MKLHSNRITTMSDEKIVELYWKRDEQAIKETDIKYKKFLLSIAYNIVHDMSDSEECLNDTYIGAWKSIPPSKPVVLQAFLSTIMRRTAINCFNAKKRQKRIASEFTVSLSEIEDFISCEDDMEAEMEKKELAKTISNYVRSLPDRQMYIFVSRFYFAESISAIGKELSCSTSTVKREINVIKNGLKKHLESEGYVL
ncbi:MAG: sigma-70 family RNA polymerase sigma factor [Ruminococcaceae bacterium]|nr:sigma-70 family RNA polymerase sigma factor [Oscillospiraceae bacterium]